MTIVPKIIMSTFQSIAGRILLTGRTWAMTIIAAAHKATMARRFGRTIIRMYITRKIAIAKIFCIKCS